MMVSTGVCRSVCALVMKLSTIQALVYDILPSTTAVFSYAIGSRELSANGQFLLLLLLLLLVVVVVVVVVVLKQ